MMYHICLDTQSSEIEGKLSSQMRLDSWFNDYFKLLFNQCIGGLSPSLYEGSMT